MEEDNNCRICLDTIEHDNSSIDSCNHRFHKNCIVQWSKITNSCPLCKERFTRIKCGRECVIVSHKEQVWQNSQFPMGNLDHGCNACGASDREDVLLICDGDGCDNMYHIYCLQPVLPCVPDGDWFCPDCVQREAAFGFDALVEEEEEMPSESDVEDIEYVPSLRMMIRQDSQDMVDEDEEEESEEQRQVEEAYDPFAFMTQDANESPSPVRTRAQKRKKPPSEDVWRCKVCTYDNPCSLSQCDICGNDRSYGNDDNIDELDDFISEPPPPAPRPRKKRTIVEKPDTPVQISQPRKKKPQFGNSNNRKKKISSAVKSKFTFMDSDSSEDDSLDFVPVTSNKKRKSPEKKISKLRLLKDSHTPKHKSNKMKAKPKIKTPVGSPIRSKKTVWNFPLRVS